jgi:putative N6-adenine-specific DNA methylase
MEAISGDDGSLAHSGPPPTWVAPDDSHFQAMRAAGTSLRRTFGGWRVCLLSPDGDLPKQLGMQPRRKTPLFNGAIECRLYCFDIFERAQG